MQCKKPIHTLTPCMTYNAGSRRMKVKQQQGYTDMRVRALSLESDMIRMTWAHPDGSQATLGYPEEWGGNGYTNGFTIPSGIRPANVTRLNLEGSTWEIIDQGRKIKYNGHSESGFYYAHITLKANTSNSLLSKITIDDHGSGYNLAPAITFTGGVPGSGGEATAHLNGAGEIESITLDKPGSGWSSAPTVVITPTMGGADGAATAHIEAKTVVSLAIFNQDGIVTDNTASVVCSSGTLFTGTTSLNFVAPLSRGDILEVKLQTNATKPLSYQIYSLTLGVRPIGISGTVM